MKIANNNNLTDQQSRELIQQLAAHCPTVVHFVNWIRFSYETFSNPPKSIKSFVRAVAASLPVCALIKPNEAIHSLVRELIDGKNVFSDAEKVELLHEEFLIMFAALRS